MQIIRKLLAIWILLATLHASILPLSYAQIVTSAQSTEYFLRGVEAAEWISSFAVTPPEAGWGIPYHNSSAWGLDPFWYDNSTIMGGASGIPAGERQSRAFLIGGHDSGLAAQALLRSYLYTKDPSYLARFSIYLDYFRRSQLPSPHVAVKAVSSVPVGNATVLIDNSGFFAEQSNVLAGKDGIYGTPDDEVVLVSAFPSPEHGNPIARATMLYYDITGDKTVLPLLTKYAEWLLRIQVKSGNYSGAFPVTPQSYIQRGWLPRMYETTESATVLLEMYRITRNSTYLRAGEDAAKVMLRLQHDIKKNNDTKIDGSLPFVWAGRRYNPDPLTNHAGFSLSAWMLAYQFTGNSTYLYGQGGTKEKPTGGAIKYADWLLSWQITYPSTPWGDHAYSNDTNAIGGYYYSYNATGHKREGFAKAQAVWSAASSVGPLLQLSNLVGNSKYTESAKLAAAWLAKMKYDDLAPKQVQGLTIFKNYRGSWWGLYPQAYMPDASEIQPIKEFVQRGLANPEKIAKPNASKTWYERTFGIDFNLELFRMASRGVKYMKMTWSWWPDLGFEPRYGGDVARGYFDMANYLKVQESMANLNSERSTIKDAISQASRFRSEFRNSLHLLQQADSQYGQAIADMQQGRWELSAEKFNSAKTIADAAFRSMKEVAENSITQASSETNLLSEYRWFNAQARSSFASAINTLENAKRASEKKDYVSALENSLAATKLLASALQVDMQDRLDSLDRTRSDLADARIQLTQTRVELTSARNQLSDVESQLNNARQQIQQTSQQLQSTRETLANTNKELETAKSALDASRKDIDGTKSSLDEVRGRLASAQDRLILLTENLDIQSGGLEKSNKEVLGLSQQLQNTQIGAMGALLAILAVVFTTRRKPDHL